jgi:HK97 family phage prohead protease
MTTKLLAPREGLYRGLPEAPVLLRAEDDAPQDNGNGSTMSGHFAVFDTWTEIHSWFEGDFLERLAPGAFTKTLTERMEQIRVQFDHGFDTHIGSAPLGPLQVAREDDFGAYFEVPLLDTDYNRERILPLLQGRTIDGRNLGSQLGSSFRFQVLQESWVEEPARSDHNPNGLPERTVTEVRVMELGPVVFPAYPTATAGVRSLTDHYLERTRELRSSAHELTPAAAAGTAAEATDEPAVVHSTGQGERISVTAARTQTLRALEGNR